MEYETQDNNNGSFMERMKESPRTVSAIIIVVIVIAAIYAFSGNNQTKNPIAEESVAVVAESSAPSASTNPAPEMKKEGKLAGDAMMTPVAVVDKNVLMEKSKALPAGKTTDKAYIETAQKGDGLTHLARRAVTRYLASNDVGYAVTNEHRIYMEDYVRKHMDKHHVTIGQENTIPMELVKQAVESAKQLNTKQLHNLTKYTHALN